MYEGYWQLRSRPFGNSADPRFYYPSEVHQGALLKLRYAVESRLGAALLVGASGLGKTLLVHVLKRQLPETISPVVHVVFPQMTSRELLAYLAAEFDGNTVGERPSADISIRRLKEFLAQNSDRSRHALVVVDEAHLMLDSDLMECLRLLMNFESSGGPHLSLLLVGQPTLLPALDFMPGFEERLGVKCLLRPLTLDETISYVIHRMAAAGATREIFTQEALGTLHQLTLGHPRRVNRLCDLALLIGFAEEHSSIGAAQIESVCSELIAIAPE